MKPYQKNASVSTMLVSNSIALGFPLLGLYNGQLQPHSLWAYISLGLQILPLTNVMRLLMRATLHIRSNTPLLLGAWLLSLGSLGAALWWIPRYAGVALDRF